MRDNDVTLFCTGVSDEEKSFVTLIPDKVCILQLQWGLYYKTFYGSNCCCIAIS
jgi:hypothetical protein